MINEVVMPQMGADMKEGTILAWRKQEGDKVERGDIIAEIETDKANVEIEAFAAGIFRKAMQPEGAVVPVGNIIAIIADADADISKYTAAPVAAVAPASPAPVAIAAPPAPVAIAAPPAPVAPAAPAAAPVAPRANGERLRVSPVARRAAAEAGLDVATITGTGPDGRIVLRDIEAARTAAPAAAAPTLAPRTLGEDIVTDVPLSRIRQTIARRMQQSKQEAPHYYLMADVDMTEAMAFRAQANEALGDNARISVNDLIILATAKALAQHPKFNAWWLEGRYQLHSQINIGIAVALDDGLVTPALFDCDRKGLAQLSNEARDLAERARAGRLRPEEYAGPTFGISNLGAYGVEVLTAIINPPQVAALGIGAVTEKAVVRNGQIVVRSMMAVVLSADHRATDGADGARFLKSVRENLETPGLMLL